MTVKQTLSIGSLSGFLAIALGAFAAHGLKETLSPTALEVFKTAAYYQLAHALILVCLGLMDETGPHYKRLTSKLISRVSFCIVLGTILFSGSLYVLALTDVKALGMVTPFGGMFFMFGWITLFWASLTKA
jgi:uncharacterized membrane protein YgdD (TMEM256/DUF423 family)